MPIRLIAGLGNPGKEYEATRHNVGFWLLERFAVREHVGLRKDAKYQAYVGRHAASGAWLVLPQTFMNASGKAVAILAGFFKIPPEEILVIHDELDFAPGTAKMKQGGGIAGHNGLKDISARLGSHDYWRLRIGIGHPGDKDQVADYVLKKPSAEDRQAIEASIEGALEILPLCLAGDMQAAMQKLHTQERKPAAPRAEAPKKAEAPKQPEARGAADAPAKRGERTEAARETAAPAKKEGGVKGLFSSLLHGSGEKKKK